jgi:lipopolysaccharide cholinephosphotransferase
MKKTINTKKGVITFVEKEPVSGAKTLNIKIATKNLLDLKKIIDGHSIKFGLIYGTLLGAIREHNFIKHDEDIDLFMLDEDKDSLLTILQEIIDAGFQIIRYDGKLLSISRNDEYIDFYFFRKNKFLYRKCDVGLKVKAKYLENTVDYKFLGKKFQVPKNAASFLVDLYGKNWKIPIKDVAAMDYNKYIILREKIKDNLPFLFIFISNIKKLFHINK